MNVKLKLMKRLILIIGFLLQTFESQLYNECHTAFFKDPQCIDQPAGYYCNCGPGFRWNSKQCIAAGVDSKMVFLSLNTSFSVLDRITMPKEFSFSLWVRPKSSGILVSLVHNHLHSEDTSQIVIGINNNSYPYIRYKSNEKEIDYSLILNQWNHIVWSQKVIDQKTIKWTVYINKAFEEKIIFTSAENLKGEIILGQLSKSFKSEVKNFGFSGEIAHFNVWNYSIHEKEMKTLYNDCLYNFCGNVIQWSDFRYGTRGNLMLKWPSGVPQLVKPCIKTNKLIQSCDGFCSRHIGAQCKVEIRANVEWERTKANKTISYHCPMPPQLIVSPSNSSLIIDMRPNITRACEETVLKEGKWKDPDINTCISNEWKILLRKKKELQELVGQCLLNDLELIDALNLFVNLTQNLIIINAIDLSLCIDILDVFTLLKEKQESKCPRFMIEISQKREEIHMNQYMIIKLIVKIANNLLDSKNIFAWNYTRPGGFEGRKLLGILNNFYQITTENVINLIKKYFYMPREMTLLINDPSILFKLQVFQWSEFKGAAFPDMYDINEISSDWINSNELATIALASDFLNDKNQAEISLIPSHVVIITVIYRDVALKVSHSTNPEHIRMNSGSMPLWNQRINADVIDITVSVDGKKITKIKPQSFKINFLYKDYSNISNTNCLSLAGNIRESNIYSTSRSTWNRDCHIGNLKSESVVCLCNQLGVFTVATDMFNDLWKKKKQPNNLLALPSYFGCTVSSLLCSVSLIMLIYLRTSSITSSIHKHFSMAIVAGQMSYMFGIDKYEYKIACRIFSLCLHYFFLSCFTWLMNEAFNLYIVITYAVHSHGDSTDGHMWRFYVLGWIMPAILVAVVAGINKSNYYAKNMCWINQNDEWLFYGPAIAVIAVSILVLVFTAKEHHESSYTKNEKDNKAIINQAKAIWTQIILLTLSWTFAFICVRMQGIIVKYLYGLFNSLQGAFYIVFYYLLNDEVQNIYTNRNNKENKRKASEQIDDGLTDIPYVSYSDSFGNPDQHRTNENDGLSEKRRSFFTNVIENFNIITRRSQSKENINDRRNNDTSDYELITSV